MPVSSGDRFGRFEILTSLGMGGMGEVFRAHDPQLNREVAIKLIKTDLDATGPGRVRFAQEARAASALNHPNIVTIYDIGEDNGRPYIVMELLEGRSLRQMLAQPLTSEQVLGIATQIADALAAAHERFIVHRDLKPDNVFVTRQGTVKILDFGLARICEKSSDVASVDPTARRLTAAGMFLGTPGYAAPEAFAGTELDMRADLFSFGAILYELSCGVPAFRRDSLAETMAATLRDNPSPLPARPDLPPRFAEIVTRCLHKNPQHRFASTRDLHADLLALMNATPTPTPSLSERLPSTRPRRPLPSPRTPLIGREVELEGIHTLMLNRAVRLVTLTGPGGGGKTRLAIAVAELLLGHYEGQIFFIPLGPLRDPSRVVPMIAEALKAPPPGAGESPLEAVAAELNATAAPTLVILDNFEQVITAAVDLSELLEASPHVSFLITSREVLHLYGEYDVPVVPLRLPRPEDDPSSEELAASPAVALFVDRARAANPEFRLTEENEDAVLEICRRLDGLPLALELAAARVRTLPPQALVARLGQRLQFLKSGARDLPDRQMTMRRAIDWSYGLLNPDEQTMLRRLATFAGSFSLEGVEAVYDPFGKLDLDVVDAVASLVDKSLLQKTAEDLEEARFSMLETIREYAVERLAESSDRESTYDAHAAYFLILAEEGAAILAAGESAAWLDLFTREHENFRVALDWLLAARKAEWGLRLSLGLFHFWERNEHLLEGRTRLSAFLDLPDADVVDDLRARALFALGVFAYAQSDSNEAIRRNLESLELHRKCGDRRGMAVAHNSIGIAYTDLRDFEPAAQHLASSLEEWQAAGDEGGYARSLSNLAFVRRKQKHYDEASRLYEEAEAIFEKLGDRISSAWSLNHHGGVAADKKEWEEAASYYERALDSFRALRDPWGTASTLADQGTIARGEGNRQKAATLYREALMLFRQVGHRRGIARMLESILALVADDASHEQVLTLASAAAALRSKLGAPGPITDQAVLMECVENARRNLPPDVAERAHRRGSLLSLSKAVRYADSALGQA